MVVRGGTVVAMDAAGTLGPRDVEVGDDGRIVAVVPTGHGRLAARSIDATGRVVLPGLTQVHLHLCQTLFRGLCEDRSLLSWLRERTWPMEAAHNPASLRASVRLGTAELLLGGTTAILDMGTVNHHDAAFEAARESGIRYTGGKAMMDVGEGVPAGLMESTEASLRESDRLAARWHNTEGGRLRYAYCPRFSLSCTPELMRGVGDRVRGTDLRIHTHAVEHPEDTAAVREIYGYTSGIRLLDEMGLVMHQAALAHAVWPGEGDMELLAQRGAHVAHCPSSNMKVGAGMAPVVEYLAAGVNVGLGADGGAVSNRLDNFEMMRLAGLLAKLRLGPEALPAPQIVEMATIGGARALGLGDQIGSLEPGKLADLVVLDLRRPHAAPSDDLYTQIVYSASASDVETVLVGGQPVVEHGRLLTMDLADVLHDAQVQRAAIVERSGISRTVA